MKRLISTVVSVLAVSAYTEECKDGVCTLPENGEAAYTVMSPVPESAVEPIKPAPRLKSLDGKTIALVGGSFMANVTHPELKRLILAGHPTAKVYLLSEIGSAGPYPRPGVVRREKDEFQRKLKEFKVDAIDAQAELSEKLHDLANRPQTTGGVFDAVVNLALQCDRRQTEIASLAMQLAEAVQRVGNDPAAEKLLEMKLAALLPRQALSMHGNAEALDKMKAKLQPLAERLENFAARPNASLSSSEFIKYAVEFKDACDVLAKAAANGFPAPDGKGRVMPDGDLLASLAKLANDARAKLEDARRSIGEAYLRNFIEHNLGVAKELTVFAPENMWAVKKHSSLLAVAVELCRELGMAALEYMANPDSGETRRKIENVLDSYAKLDEDDLRDAVEDIMSGCRQMMNSDKKWRKVSTMFHPKTSALRTQVAHFFKMVKAVRLDMTPEQFLSTTSARATASRLGLWPRPTCRLRRRRISLWVAPTLKGRLCSPSYALCETPRERRRERRSCAGWENMILYRGNIEKGILWQAQRQRRDRWPQAAARKGRGAVLRMS